MPEVSITPRYYPTLDTVISAEELPELLGFLKQGLAGLLGNIHYKDLQYSKSVYGDRAFYSLRIVSRNRLDLELPGTGIFLTLNPDIDDTSITSFPISVSYEWPILAYVRSFDIKDFSFSAKALYNLGLQILKISEAQVVANAINVFTVPADGNTSVIQQLINDLGLPIPEPEGPNPMPVVLQAIRDSGKDPAFAVFERYIASGNDQVTIKAKSDLFFKSLLPTEDLEAYIQELILPKFSTTLALSAGIEFPRKLLQPVDPVTLEVIPPNDSESDAPRAGFRFGEALFFVNTEEGFGYTMDLALSTTAPAMIGNTGLILEISRFKVDLSDARNIPEADADGRGPGFKGVYAETAAITLPKKWFDKEENNPNTTARLAGYDLLIGTGGLSGQLALEVIDGTSDPRLVKTFGKNGFEISFTAFDIAFQRGKVVSSNILGGLKIPKLKDANGNEAQIDISGHLDAEGDFLITASEQDGFQPIQIPEVLKLYIQSVELGSTDGDFFLGVTADLELTNPIMNKLLCNGNGGDNVRIALPGVRIYSNGNFEVVGGSIALPTNFGLCLGPVKMSITNLNYSSHQQEYNGVLREYKCWGFDGALNLNPLGVEVRGDGVRYYYTVDDDVSNGKPHHSYIRITTIEVDIIIPGNASPDTATAIIRGSLTLPEPGGSEEFAGAIEMKLPKMGISGGAAMRLQPKYPAYLVDAYLEIPTPIPLGATGLGIYGFRGLLGYRYVAQKEKANLPVGQDRWYDYYAAPQRGINPPKFSSPDEYTDFKDPVSIGAGATLATLGNASVINFRVFVLLSMPSVLFIEGKANILSKQVGLDDTDEPPFFAFLAISDEAIEAGLGADFRIPKNNGWILDMQAKVEAGFFFKNPSAWYVNFGTREDPISARLLTLITAQTYLQLSGKGIEAGARAEFNFDKRYGPVRVGAYLYIEVGGYISFERPQLGGYLAAGGGARVDVKIISVDIALDLLFSVEAAKPFLIYGKFRLCVKVKVFFVKIKFCGKVELKWEKSNQVDRTPIPPLSQERVLELVKGVHMLDGTPFSLALLNNNITDASYTPSANNNRFNKAILPLDTYIDVQFEKPLRPNAITDKIGGVNAAPKDFMELMPPQKSVRGKVLRQVTHDYAIEDISIKAWNGSSWQDYHPYQALAEGASDLTNERIAELQWGHWQKTGKGYNALRLLASNPFSYTQMGEPGWFTPEQMGVTASVLFCETPAKQPRCAHWLKTPLGGAYVAYLSDDSSFTNIENLYTVGQLAFWVKGPLFLEQLAGTFNAQVVDTTNPFGFARSLEIYNFMGMEVRFPNPSPQCSFKLTTVAQGVTFSLYRTAIADTAVEPVYELVKTEYRTRAQLTQEVTFETPEDTITRVIIQPDFLNLDEITTLNAALETVYDQGFQALLESETEGDLENGMDTTFLATIKQQIVNLIQQGCTDKSPGDSLAEGIGSMQIGSSFIVGPQDLELDGFQDYRSCTTLIHEVCWLSEVDYRFNSLIPGKAAIEEDFERSKDAQGSAIAPIWRPDTKYYLHLKLKDVVDGETDTSAGEYHYYYGFRTVGPLGHYHNASGVTYGGQRSGGKLLAPEQYALTNLNKYIDYKRSYPNANGNLLQAKPLFYTNGEATLQLFFTKPQTYHMFSEWPAFGNGFPKIESGMRIIIKDPVNDTVIPYPLPENWDETVVPGGTEAWDDDDQPREPMDLRLLNNLLVAHDQRTQNEGTSCIATGGNRIQPRTKTRTMVLTNLKPEKLYTAIVYNEHRNKLAEVHRYGFQTSRYGSFTEQVNSYLLDDGKGHQKEAVFRIVLALSPETINTAFSLIKGTPNAAAKALEGRYADPFDRVMEGVFGMAPLPSAESTEFNAIVDQNTGDTIALLIRNPEPFNDPKIPDKDLEKTVVVLNNANNNVDGNYEVLHAKDKAQLWVMRNTKKITNNALRLRFQYLLWNGNTYAEKGTVLVEGLNVNI
ncbi:MAG: hypothetical protein AAGF77_07005 [Bacteroidota bacterium]